MSAVGDGRALARMSAASDPQVAQMRQSVADLATSQRELHLRVEALTTLIEQRFADVPGPSPLPTLPPAPASLRRSFWRRAFRFALRKTLGTARKLWHAAHPDPPWADEVVKVRGVSPAKIPRLFTPDQASEARDEDLLWTSPPPDDLPASFGGAARILAAVETLDLLRCDLPGGSRWIVRRGLWSAEEGFDLIALRLAVDFAERPLGKVIGPPTLDGPLPALPDGSPLLRRSGAYLVAATDVARQWPLHLSPLAAVSSLETSRWIVAEQPLARGYDRALARALRDDPALAVAVLARDELSRRRAATLARMHERVWYLGDFEPESLGGVLAHLGATESAIVDLMPGEPEPWDATGRDAARRELGADDGAVVVLWSDDLVPAARPEEFVLLAHAMRDRPEFLFVLSGEGPLLGPVRDLRAYLGVERLVLTFGADAAADFVCRTAEAAALDDRLSAARAAGLRTLVPGSEPLEKVLREMMG